MTKQMNFLNPDQCSIWQCLSHLSWLFVTIFTCSMAMVSSEQKINEIVIAGIHSCALLGFLQFPEQIQHVSWMVLFRFSWFLVSELAK